MANYDLTYEGSEVQKILDTGDELQTAGYIFRGEATPSTVPGTPTERVAYIGGPGTYTNFGGSITVPVGRICVFKYTGSAWSNQVIDTKVSDGAAYKGIATSTTNPGSPIGSEFYLAVQAGTYTNFGSLTVTAGINILKYNGSTWSVQQAIAIDAEPTQGSANLVKSSGVLNSILQNGPAFDLSAYNAQGGVLATYADLSAALTALNALPADFKKGGMSMKYVQTSDNNYTQARLKANAFTLDIDAWEVVDENIVVNCSNPVESYGIRKYIRDYVLSNENSIINLKNTLEQGSIGGLNSNNWSYSDSTTRLRTKEGTYLYLLAGDVIRLTDYSVARMLVGYKGDYTKGSQQWITNDFEVRYDGEYVVLMEHIPSETVTVENFGSLLQIKTYSLGDAAFKGVDNNPVSESNNLVKSGGVYKETNSLSAFTDAIKRNNFYSSQGFLQPKNDSDLSEGFIFNHSNDYKFCVIPINLAIATELDFQNVAHIIRFNTFDYKNPENSVVINGETFNNLNNIEITSDTNFVYFVYGASSVPKINNLDIESLIYTNTTNALFLQRDINKSFGVNKCNDFIGFIYPKDNSDLSKGFNRSVSIDYKCSIISVLPNIVYTFVGTGYAFFASSWNNIDDPTTIIACDGETWSAPTNKLSPSDAIYLYILWSNKNTEPSINGVPISYYNKLLSERLNTIESQTKQRFSVLGDSISTYVSFVPDGYRCFYGDDGSSREHDETDIHDVSQTWWYDVIKNRNFVFEENSSYSGSSVCKSEHSFLDRMNEVGRPDILAVYGGTNDDWLNLQDPNIRQLGDYKYDNITEEDKVYFRPAFAYMLNYLIKHNPNTIILVIVPDNIRTTYRDSIIEISSHYNLPYVELTNISSPYSGHPGKNGMLQIRDFILHKLSIIQN